MEFRFEAGSPVSAAFSVKGTITATFEIGGGGSPEPPVPPVIVNAEDIRGAVSVVLTGSVCTVQAKTVGGYAATTPAVEGA